MATNREDIRQAAHNWITKYFWNDSVDKPRLLIAFEAGVLYSEATLSTREKNCKEIEEENKRLKDDNDKIKLEAALDYADLVRERENVKTLRELSECLYNALKALDGFKNWRQEGQPEFEQMLQVVDKAFAKYHTLSTIDKQTQNEQL